MQNFDWWQYFIKGTSILFVLMFSLLAFAVPQVPNTDSLKTAGNGFTTSIVSQPGSAVDAQKAFAKSQADWVAAQQAADAAAHNAGTTATTDAPGTSNSLTSNSNSSGTNSTSTAEGTKSGAAENGVSFVVLYALMQ